MPKSRHPYPAKFRQQILELAQAARDAGKEISRVQIVRSTRACVVNCAR